MLTVATFRTDVSTGTRWTRCKGFSRAVIASIAHASRRVCASLTAVESRVTVKALRCELKGCLVTISSFLAKLRSVVDMFRIRVIALFAVVASWAWNRINRRTKAVAGCWAHNANSFAFFILVGTRWAWNRVFVA